MDQRTRDRAALIVAGLGLVIGLAVILFGRFDPGVRLARTETFIVVEHVEPRSIAALYGLEPGMIVIELHGVGLVQMPQYVEPMVYPSPDPLTGEMPPFEPRIEPLIPTVIERDPAFIDQLLAQPATGLVAVREWTLDHTLPDGSGQLDPNSFEIIGLYDDGVDGIRTRLTTFVLGAVMLLLVFWWLAGGRAGEALRTLAAPLAVATGMPFLVEPLDVSWSPPLIALSGLLLTAAMVPLAIGLLERIEDAEVRRTVGSIVVGCVVGAAVVGVSAMVTIPWAGEGFLRWTLLAAIPLIPGLAAAGPIQRVGSSPSPSGRLLETTEYAAAGVTPAIALASTGAANGLPLAFWFLIILAAGRFTIRPLVRLATQGDAAA